MPNGDGGSTDGGAARGTGFLAGVEGSVIYELDDGAGEGALSFIFEPLR